MRISYHPGHAGQGREFLWRALGITACNHDFCIWVFPMDASNGGAGVLVSGGSDGAGIQDNEIGFQSRIGRVKALGRQLAV
jgi:hypothetical protein